MAQSYVTTAGVLIIPGAYPQLAVQNGASGLATTGVIFLVGEADGGPDFTLEADLTANAFGPDQVADVVAKYKSGPLVDAFKVASQPANDPDIVGAPSLFILVKTNPSTKASAALTKVGGGTYGTLFDKSYGQIGNLIYFTVSQATPETMPTTSTFTYIPPVGTVAIGARVNGGAEVSRTGVANETPTAFVAGVGGLTGISATGGANRGLLTSVHGSLTLAVVAGNSITLTLSGIANWDTTPVAGDTLVIPTGSVMAGAGNANVGAYVITAATATVVSATKLSDGGKAGGVVGTITAPVGVTTAAVVGATADAVAYTPVTITLSSATVIDGLGKSLEINQLTSGTDLLSRTAYVLGTTTPVTWISATGAPQLLTSASEYSITLNNNRQMDSVTEAITAGGKVLLQVGYTGTTCPVTVTATQMVFTPTGGASAGQTITINLAQFPTVADLAAYINSFAGFKAAVGSNAVSQTSPLATDEGTFNCGSDFGNMTLRLKGDAVSFFTAIQQNSQLVQLGNPAATAAAGIPAVVATNTFLSGGARGGTTDAIYNSAIDALQAVKGNFLVPLFSANATTEKTYTYNPTDASSTYTIANIQAYAKTHCLTMSTLKRRRNRQAFVAQRDTFANVQNAAAVLSSARVALAFQDVKVTGANGIVQAQPHMLAALAAGMQAAGFYKAIVNKGINCNGVLQAGAGTIPDFKDSLDTNLETALNAGILPARKNDTGGFSWVSDQTTYSKDNNFVYNSIQAVYATDIIQLTCAQRMEKSFVGQSTADITAALALAALESIMADFLRLKLIAVSDDAPKGFKNAQVKISGTTMIVSIEIKLAGAIYFIPINFLVSQVQQSA